MLRFIKKVIVRVLAAFALIYGLNLLINPINIVVPINIITVVIVSIFEIPGVLLLIGLFLLL